MGLVLAFAADSSDAIKYRKNCSERERRRGMGFSGGLFDFDD